MNTAFIQDGKVYAICSHNVPPLDLAKFIRAEAKYMGKIPRAEMRTITTDEFKAMPFGEPVIPKKPKQLKKTSQVSLL
jgi:hypothetical protein